MGSITKSDFGKTKDGQAVDLYTLTNGPVTVKIMTYGGIVTEILTPDRNGKAADVVLGFASLDKYLAGHPFFGAIAGRYANRIAKGRFELDGERYQLAINDGMNCLHGEPAGFGASLWEGRPQQSASDGSVSLLLERVSPDGEMGFPGTMHVSVRYTLGADMSWRIDYEATTDRPTVVNLTSHAYFNLAGAESGSALGQRLTLLASRYTVPDPNGIPMRHEGVDGTPFDFRRERVIGADARYDHNWLLDHPLDGALHAAASLQDPTSGRRMDMLTTEPAIQFYAGTWLNGSLTSPGGKPFTRGAGICLETQHNPDSPNRAVGPDWPSTVLRPGELFRSATLHRFRADRPA